VVHGPSEMPQELEHAVDKLPSAARVQALSNWEAIGGAGRAEYLKYLDHGRGRGRGERARLAAEQLVAPHEMLWVPGGNINSPMSALVRSEQLCRRRKGGT
jgi:hypothetical protein